MEEGCEVLVDFSRVEMKANMRRLLDSSSDAGGRRRSCLVQDPAFRIRSNYDRDLQGAKSRSHENCRSVCCLF